MIKKIICILFFISLFSISISAEETDFYKEQLEQSGMNDLVDSLDENVKDFLHNNQIDINDYNWVNNLNSENIFNHIINFFKSGIKMPFLAFGGMLGIILLNTILLDSPNRSTSTVVSYSATLAIAAIVISPLFVSINTAISAMQSCAGFMTAFIPIFGVVIASAGKAATSLSMSSLLLGAANGVSLLSNFVVVPMIGGYLSLSIASSVSPTLNGNALSSAIKKLSLWILSFISTIFLGILSVQTAVNASADNLSLRTAKFIIGSSVPVAGGVLSEALSTLTASLSLLKSSVGAYGIVICCIIFLPIIVELLVWRITLWLADFVTQSFALAKISQLLQSLDTVLSVLIGIILLTAAMFILSLSVVIGSGS